MKTDQDQPTKESFVIRRQMDYRALSVVFSFSCKFYVKRNHSSRFRHCDFARAWKRMFGCGFFLPHDTIVELYMLSSCVCSSVRPYVRPSATSRCFTKMAKPRISKATPCDSPGNLFFWSQKSRRNSYGVTSNGGSKQRWGRLERRLSTNISLYLRNSAR